MERFNHIRTRPGIKTFGDQVEIPVVIGHSHLRSETGMARVHRKHHIKISGLLRLLPGWLINEPIDPDRTRRPVNMQLKSGILLLGEEQQRENTE